MKLNKEWHQLNPMPKKPTLEERLAWHLEHSKNCECRKMPEKIAAKLLKKNNLSKGIPAKRIKK